MRHLPLTTLRRCVARYAGEHEHLFLLTENHFLKQKDWDARRPEFR
jgi:hypothetical protein